MTFVLTGDARERGRQHGEARREAIRARLAQSTPPAPLEPLMDPWWRTVRAASGEIAAELLGIAEGSGSTVAEIVLLNGFEASGLPQRTGCTAVATAAADGVVVAQTWDADEELAASLEVHQHRRSDGSTRSCSPRPAVSAGSASTRQASGWRRPTSSRLGLESARPAWSCGGCCWAAASSRRR
jgi:hypothetical protein